MHECRESGEKARCHAGDHLHFSHFTGASQETQQFSNSTFQLRHQPAGLKLGFLSSDSHPGMVHAMHYQHTAIEESVTALSG